MRRTRIIAVLLELEDNEGDEPFVANQSGQTVSNSVQPIFRVS
jgi:hypothetical protein